MFDMFMLLLLVSPVNCEDYTQEKGPQTTTTTLKIKKKQQNEQYLYDTHMLHATTPYTCVYATVIIIKGPCRIQD